MTENAANLVRWAAVHAGFPKELLVLGATSSATSLLRRAAATRKAAVAGRAAFIEVAGRLSRPTAKTSGTAQAGFVSETAFDAQEPEISASNWTTQIRTKDLVEAKEIRSQTKNANSEPAPGARQPDFHCKIETFGQRRETDPLGEQARVVIFGKAVVPGIAIWGWHHLGL